MALDMAESWFVSLSSILTRQIWRRISSHRSCTPGTCIQVCFGAKEIQDRHTVLSERAVLIRVHRINAATSERSAGAKTNCPNDGVQQETPKEAKKNSQNVKHFSLKGFAGFLPISKIRRRLSLDSSPTSSDGK